MWGDSTPLCRKQFGTNLHKHGLKGKKNTINPLMHIPARFGCRGSWCCHAATFSKCPPWVLEDGSSVEKYRQAIDIGTEL
jgi:hypothetical protein